MKWGGCSSVSRHPCNGFATVRSVMVRLAVRFHSSSCRGDKMLIRGAPFFYIIEYSQKINFLYNFLIEATNRD